MTKRLSLFYRRISSSVVLYSLILSAVWADLPPHNPVPGGIAVVSISNFDQQKPTARFGGKPLYVKSANNGWTAIVGLPQHILPGKYLITLDSEDGQQSTKSFRIDPLPASQNQRTVNLPESLNELEFESVQALPKKSIEPVSEAPATDADSLTNSLSESALHPSFQFQQLVSNGSYLPYGWILRKAQSPSVIDHDWVTYITAARELVKAPANALVERIFLDSHSGITIILDHGQGLKSLVTYLNDTILKPGDHVRRGDVIGTVADLQNSEKGRVDWQLLLNDYLIDPLQFTNPA